MNTEATMTHGAPGGAASPAPAKSVTKPAAVIGFCTSVKDAISALRTDHRTKCLPASRIELQDMAIDLESVARCALEMAAEFRQSAEAIR